jgi:hypothetical protein
VFHMADDCIVSHRGDAQPDRAVAQQDAITFRDAPCEPVVVDGDGVVGATDPGSQTDRLAAGEEGRTSFTGSKLGPS